MRYEAPNSLDQAVALLANEPGDARVLAGGTDLLVQIPQAAPPLSSPERESGRQLQAPGPE